MTMKINAPSMAGEEFSATLNGKTITIPAYGAVEAPDMNLTAYPLRVNALEAEITNPTEGRAVALANGRTALDLLDVPTERTIIADIVGGGKAEIQVALPPQARGHVTAAQHYWLPQNANGHFICEPGQRHRKWYLSKSPTALTKAQIAANAGVAESVVTAAWLLTRPQYGGTPQTAISAALFSMLRTAFIATGQPSRSDHWFLECGYDYTDLGWTGFSGEDELHPMLVTSWGSGDKPIIKQSSANAFSQAYVVFDTLTTNRQSWLTWYGHSVILSHLSIGLNIEAERQVGLTIYECDILRAWRDAPHPTDGVDANGKWKAKGGNHIQGIWSSDIEGLAIIDNQIDHAGWADGYDYNGDATMPQPPFKYSHCLYLGNPSYDTTVRGNLLSRPAAQGIGRVGGCHLEANLIVDANYVMQLQSGGKDQYSTALDNVAFSAGWKRVAYEEGGYNWGMSAYGSMSTMSGNILAHQANPDDEAEKEAKPLSANWDYGVTPDPAMSIEDTQSWKWSSKVPARNVEGIAPQVLDETTIQRFTGMKMGETFANIVEMVDYVKGLPRKGAFVDEAVRWSKSRFGTPIPDRSAPADLSFIPDTNFDGFRWDNRRNWSTKDYPGDNIADTVDLAGHFVRYALTNTDIAALKTSGGILDVTSGKLEIGALTDAAELVIRKSGQVWIDAANQPLKAMMTSGRLALLGAAANLDLHAGGQAQALLGPNCTVPTGKALVIGGQRARVGWDGTGTAALAIAGKLEFQRGICVDLTSSAGAQDIRFAYKHIGKEVVGSISGAKGKVGAVERVTSNGFTFRVWLYDVVGTPVVGDVFTLASSPKPGGVDLVYTSTVSAVLDQGVAPLQRFRSGAIGTGLVEPTVAATVTLASTAQIVVPAGLPSQDLTGPGITVVNNGATLPAGVSITGGKLVYTA